MNHIADKTPVGFVTGAGLAHRARGGDYLAAASMPIYSLLAFGSIGGPDDKLAALAMATVGYVLTIYVFYSVMRLAFERNTTLLWCGVLAGAVAGYLVSGLGAVWEVIGCWGMFFFAGATVGRMNNQGFAQQRIYVLGALLVGLFLTVQYLPVWPHMRQLTENAVQTMLAGAEQSLRTLGYSAEAAKENVAYARKMFDGFVRVIPATTILSGLMQFSIAYLLFVYRLGLKDPMRRRVVPFTGWRVPFGVTPVVLVAIPARFWGSEGLSLVADNVLAILAVYYCVGGLALIEHFLTRLNLSRIFRVLFYVMLFFTQLVGFFLTALLGFIDSFADWRRPREPQTADT